ncbi:MAG: hypothetical protein AB2L12_06385 [Smithellaceae bacterium]
MSREIKQKAPAVSRVDSSPDGRYILAGGLDSFTLWDIQEGRKIKNFVHENESFYPLAVVVGLGNYSKERTSSISKEIGYIQTPLIINFGKDYPIYQLQ